LAGNFTSYDFNGLPLTSGDAVNQLEGGIVYFEGAAYGRPTDPIVGDSFLFGTNAVYNYVANQFETPVLSIHFTMATTGAAFNFAYFGGRFTAKLVQEVSDFTPGTEAYAFTFG